MINKFKEIFRSGRRWGFCFALFFWTLNDRAAIYHYEIHMTFSTLLGIHSIYTKRINQPGCADDFLFDLFIFDWVELMRYFMMSWVACDVDRLPSHQTDLFIPLDLIGESFGKGCESGSVVPSLDDMLHPWPIKGQYYPTCFQMLTSSWSPLGQSTMALEIGWNLEFQYCAVVSHIGNEQ